MLGGKKKKNAPFTQNTIAKMPTISVTFKNIVLQFLVSLFKCGQGWHFVPCEEGAEVTVGFAPCPYLDTLSQMLLCDLSCQSLFLGRLLTPFCLEGLISPPFSLSNLPILSLKPICVVQRELSLLSLAPPLNKTATRCPFECLSPLILSFFSDTKNKQKLKLFKDYYWNIPHTVHAYFTSFHPCSHTCNPPLIHAQNSPKLFGFVITEQNTRSSGALMHC